VRATSIGRVRPKLMTVPTAIYGLLPIPAAAHARDRNERPLATVMAHGAGCCQPFFAAGVKRPVGKMLSSSVLWLNVIPRVRVCCHPEAKIPGAARRVRFETVAKG
jgi:Cu/Ag efflux pump CusA